jgi:PTS system nitrogen regulatory IIA component
MKLTDLLAPHLIKLDLQSSTKPEVIRELLELTELPPEQKSLLFDMILQREELGSTGLGNGLAIPHGRSVIVDRLHVACGVSQKGIHYQALDRKKVYLLFLLVAPHREVSNQYLPLLGSLARLGSDPDKVATLRKAKTPQEFLQFLHALEL